MNVHRTFFGNSAVPKSSKFFVFTLVNEVQLNKYIIQYVRDLHAFTIKNNKVFFLFSFGSTCQCLPKLKVT